jgi:hypothetical protein
MCQISVCGRRGATVPRQLSRRVLRQALQDSDDDLLAARELGLLHVISFSGQTTIPIDTQSILLDRVKEVYGFSILAQLSDIERISAILCNTTKYESIAQELPLDELRLHDCTRDFSRTILGLAAPKQLRFDFFDGPFADLTWIRHP